MLRDFGECVDGEDTFTSKTSVPEWDRQFRLVRVHHEHREELGRLRLAGIGADAVAVARQLGGAPSRPLGPHPALVAPTPVPPPHPRPPLLPVFSLPCTPPFTP